MESYFSKLKSQADAQLQGATDPAALAEKEEEDRNRLQAVRQDALVSRRTPPSNLASHALDTRECFLLHILVSDVAAGNACHVP